MCLLLYHTLFLPPGCNPRPANEFTATLAKSACADWVSVAEGRLRNGRRGFNRRLDLDQPGVVGSLLESIPSRFALAKWSDSVYNVPDTPRFSPLVAVWRFSVAFQAALPSLPQPATHYRDERNEATPLSRQRCCSWNGEVASMPLRAAWSVDVLGGWLDG